MEDSEKKTLKDLIISNKKILISFGLILLLAAVFFWWSDSASKKERYKNSEDFINAKVKKFQISDDLKVPHMGWNTIEHNKQSLLFDELKTEKRFYFVRSDYVQVESNEKEAILTTTSYGGNFTSSFEKENIVGVQFHPEKSHNYGKQLFQNFLREY